MFKIKLRSIHLYTPTVLVLDVFGQFRPKIRNRVFGLYFYNFLIKFIHLRQLKLTPIAFFKKDSAL